MTTLYLECPSDAEIAENARRMELEQVQRAIDYHFIEVEKLERSTQRRLVERVRQLRERMAVLEAKEQALLRPGQLARKVS